MMQGFEPAGEYCRLFFLKPTPVKGEVHVVAPGNASTSKPAVNVKSSMLTRGCSWGSPAKALKQERCLRCREWGHVVSKSSLSQDKVTWPDKGLRQCLENLSARSVQKADQKFERYVVARSNGGDIRSANHVRNVLPTKDRGKLKATMFQGSQSRCVWESQQSTAGRAPSRLASRDQIVTGRRSYCGDVERCPIKDMCKNVPCLESGQLGHEMLSCPRFWGAPGGNEAEPVSCENIFAVTPGNKEEFSVVPAGGSKQWEMPAVISSCGHQGELASKYASERPHTEARVTCYRIW